MTTKQEKRALQFNEQFSNEKSHLNFNPNPNPLKIRNKMGTNCWVNLKKNIFFDLLLVFIFLR
jgi:hypothetical protein